MLSLKKLFVLKHKIRINVSEEKGALKQINLINFQMQLPQYVADLLTNENRPLL